MPVVLGCLTPHPPIIIPEIGKSETAQVQQTIEAMRRLAGDIKQAKPETLVFISPHTRGLADAFTVKTEPILTGSFKEFGAASVSFTEHCDLSFIDELLRQADRRSIELFPVNKSTAAMIDSHQLDHGVLVPLYFIEQQVGAIPLVSLSISFEEYEEHYKLGQAIRDAAVANETRIAFIASGDLSHRLIPGAPAGYSPRGSDFDERIKEILSTGNLTALEGLDPVLVDAAGECGLRSLYTLTGIFSEMNFRSEVLSYEGPFGVGYMVAEIIPDSIVSEQKSASEQTIVAGETAGPVNVTDEMSEPVRLAMYGLQHYVRNGEHSEVPAWTSEELLNRKAGAFVCLKIAGELRGCVGTIEATQPSLAEEIIYNAVQAAMADPRFHPVTEEELPLITHSVDILGDPERINSLEQLDPKIYGVIVRKGIRTGLLLPDLEGVDTPELQVSIAKQKAGLSHAENVELYRFKVTRYE